MAINPSPTTPAARELAHRWFELFTDMVGTDPDARLRFRQAHEQEPALNAGRLMTDELLEYLRRAQAAA